MSVRGTIARNTVFNAFGRFWEAAVALVLTPYILTRLDYADWGLWSLVAVFTGYVALLDAGLSSGFTRYIAGHAAREEDDALSSVVSTGFAFYAVLGGLVAAAGWPLVDLLIDRVIPWLASSEALATAKTAVLDDLRFLLRGGLILFAVNSALASFTAVPAGLQRMGITNAIGVAASVIKFAATIAFLETGFGVRGLLWANAIVTGATGVAVVAAAFWVCPRLRVGTPHVRRDTFLRLFAFGWRTQVAKLANLINFQTDRVVATWYAGLASAGVYRLGEELALKVRQIPALLVSALIPAAADLDAREKQDALRGLYLRANKYTAAVTVPLTVFLIAAADLVMRAWLGDMPQLDRAAWVFRILMAGYFANLIAGGGMSIALGIDRPGLAMRAGIISMTANIALTILLVLWIGFYGIAIGTMLGMALSTGWFFLAMRRVVDVPLRQLAREAYLWPVAACLPGLILTLGLDWLSGTPAGRAPNLLWGGAAAAVFGITYLLALRLAPFLDAFDIDFLGRTLRLDRVPGFRRMVAARCPKDNRESQTPGRPT